MSDDDDMIEQIIDALYAHALPKDAPGAWIRSRIDEERAHGSSVFRAGYAADRHE